MHDIGLESASKVRTFGANQDVSLLHFALSTELCEYDYPTTVHFLNRPRPALLLEDTNGEQSQGNERAIGLPPLSEHHRNRAPLLAILGDEVNPDNPNEQCKGHSKPLLGAHLLPFDALLEVLEKLQDLVETYHNARLDHDEQTVQLDSGNKQPLQA